MKLFYKSIKCGCGREFELESEHLQYILYEALKAGWALDGCFVHCPDCVLSEDGIHDRMLVGITPARLEELQ